MFNNSIPKHDCIKFKAMLFPIFLCTIMYQDKNKPTFNNSCNVNLIKNFHISCLPYHHDLLKVVFRFWLPL